MKYFVVSKHLADNCNTLLNFCPMNLIYNYTMLHGNGRFSVLTLLLKVSGLVYVQNFLYLPSKVKKRSSSRPFSIQ